MGEVYRARDTKLDREVAIKVLPERVASDSDALGRFEHEAKAVAALSHPNILEIHDFGTHDGTAYAVTELLNGETLRSRLETGAMPLRHALECAQNVALGLAAAHDKGIVHRDLKPDNVFLTRDGRVKILDFGLARQRPKQTDDESHSPTLSKYTDPGTVVGTVGYMSPEQVRGAPLDARSDLFSFGSMLYEMLTGQRAFRRDTAVETMHAILNEEPPPLLETGKALPPTLERIVSHCLEKRPEQRFHSAHDLAFQLKALDVATTTSVAALAIPPRAIRGRRIVFASALLAAGLALGVLVDHLLVTAPTSLTYRRLTFDRGTVSRARFASDGSTIVYDAAWNGEPFEVFTARID